MEISSVTISVVITINLLTNLDSLEKTLKLYESRFGIEAMFKDCKTGGYNIEKTKVSEPRFLALVLRGSNTRQMTSGHFDCGLKASGDGDARLEEAKGLALAIGLVIADGFTVPIRAPNRASAPPI